MCIHRIATFLAASHSQAQCASVHRCTLDRTSVQTRFAYLKLVDDCVHLFACVIKRSICEADELIKDPIKLASSSSCLLEPCWTGSVSFAFFDTSQNRCMHHVRMYRRDGGTRGIEYLW